MKEQTATTPGIRNLAKDDAGLLLPFTTAKHKYTPLKPGAPIGPRRWTQFDKLKIALGVGQTFEHFITALKQIELELAGEKPLAEVRLNSLLLVNSLRRAIVEKSRARYSTAFYVCTLFILRDNEPVTQWSVESAEEMIEDWANAGINEDDLFFFALNMVSGFKKAFQNTKDELAAEAAKLSVITGSTAFRKNIN